MAFPNSHLTLLDNWDPCFRKARRSSSVLERDSPYRMVLHSRAPPNDLGQPARLRHFQGLLLSMASRPTDSGVLGFRLDPHDLSTLEGNLFPSGAHRTCRHQFRWDTKTESGRAWQS